MRISLFWPLAKSNEPGSIIGDDTMKRKYRVGTHVGPEYVWAASPAQAILLVARRLWGRGMRQSYAECVGGWDVEELI